MDAENRKARQVRNVEIVLDHFANGGPFLDPEAGELIAEAIGHIWLGRYGLAGCALKEAISLPIEPSSQQTRSDSRQLSTQQLRSRLMRVDSYPALPLPQFAE